MKNQTSSAWRKIFDPFDLNVAQGATGPRPTATSQTWMFGFGVWGRGMSVCFSCTGLRSADQPVEVQTRAIISREE